MSHVTQPLIVLMLDPIIHTDARPFCYGDPDCPCHYDQEAIGRLNAFVAAGLLTEDEARNIRYGHSLERSVA